MSKRSAQVQRALDVGKRMDGFTMAADVASVRDRATGAENVAGTKRKHRKELGDEVFTRVFITINSNLKTPDHDLSLMQRHSARRVALHMLGTKEGLRQVLDVEGGDLFEGGLVSNVEGHHAVEVGDKRSVHTHSYVTIHHRRRIFFNRAKMKQYFKEHMNAISERLGHGQWMRAQPNIKVKLLGAPDELAKIKAYISKDTPDDSQLVDEETTIVA